MDSMRSAGRDRPSLLDDLDSASSFASPLYFQRSSMPEVSGHQLRPRTESHSASQYRRDRFSRGESKLLENVPGSHHQLQVSPIENCHVTIFRIDQMYPAPKDLNAQCNSYIGFIISFYRQKSNGISNVAKSLEYHSIHPCFRTFRNWPIVSPAV
jgi:hypothetical protein